MDVALPALEAGFEDPPPAGDDERRSGSQAWPDITKQEAPAARFRQPERRREKTNPIKWFFAGDKNRRPKTYRQPIRYNFEPFGKNFKVRVRRRERKSFNSGQRKMGRIKSPRIEIIVT